MTVKLTDTMHTPPADMLADYASGAASPGVSLLIASHIAQSGESRANVARYEALGAALLADASAAPMSSGALDAVLDRLDADEEEIPTPAGVDAGPLPGVLMQHVGIDFARIPWRFRLPGVSEYVLDGFGGETVSLLRAKPGASVPQHTHEGEEITLVMTGAMEDGGEVFGPGDVALNDEHDDHKPRIVGDAICHCLIVRTGSLRFTGRFTRALNLIGE